MGEIMCKLCATLSKTHQCSPCFKSAFLAVKRIFSCLCSPVRTCPGLPGPPGVPRAARPGLPAPDMAARVNRRAALGRSGDMGLTTRCPPASPPAPGAASVSTRLMVGRSRSSPASHEHQEDGEQGAGGSQKKDGRGIVLRNRLDCLKAPTSTGPRPLVRCSQSNGTSARRKKQLF